MLQTKQGKSYSCGSMLNSLPGGIRMFVKNPQTKAADQPKAELISL